MGLNDLWNKKYSSASSKSKSKRSSVQFSVPDQASPPPSIPLDAQRIMAATERQNKRFNIPYAPRNTNAQIDRYDGSELNEPLSEVASISSLSIDGQNATQAVNASHRSPTAPEYRPYAARGIDTEDFASTQEQLYPSIRKDVSTASEERLGLVPPMTSHRAQAPVPARLMPSRQHSAQTVQSLSVRPAQAHFNADPAPHDEVSFALDSAQDSDQSTTKTSKHDGSQGSLRSFETKASSVTTANTLPPLQNKSALPDGEQLETLLEDDPASYDLVMPYTGEQKLFSLEDRSELMFSHAHLREIFRDTPLLLRFTNFLSNKRPGSLPLLVYYLDALKALRAIKYANSVAEALVPLPGHSFSDHPARTTMNTILEDKANDAFDALTKQDLPAFVTHTFIKVVSLSIQRRITGTLPPHLQEASEGLAEVFCLTDPSRQDNPIVFASEEFHRTTQYGMSYAIGRNCRFLQGPKTNQYSIERLRIAVQEQREVSECFLNYRRDGSPFMNLLMMAPLLDSRGKTRYFIGAQVDVSGICKECTDLPGLQRLVDQQDPEFQTEDENQEENDAFQELSEMFSESELNVVRKHGGKMHREQIEEQEEMSKRSLQPRLLIRESSPVNRVAQPSPAIKNGRLEGIFQNYLLVRPYPSLRILFCSPGLRVPGILQSPFMSRIGGSSRVRDTLTNAFAAGRGVTAKIRWVSGRNTDEEGKARWIHCTPLLGQDGRIGVWMIVLVEDESSAPVRKYRAPPPVSAEIGGPPGSKNYDAAPWMRIGDGLRRRTSQDAIRRDAASPLRPITSGGQSLDSFTIDPA